MSLIWRSIFEVDAQEGVSLLDAADTIFSDWIKSKFDQGKLAAPTSKELRAEERYSDGPLEVSVREAEKEGVKAFRGILFEDRDDQHIRTTFTALRDRAGREWAWTDLERWSSSPYERAWVPNSPRLVTDLAGRKWVCKIGNTRIQPKPSAYRGREQGEALAAHLPSPSRSMPIVVVTPTFKEGTDLDPALKRAAEIQRRLTGIAAVAVLDPDATYGLRESLDRTVGEKFGAWGGSIRTYWPGLTTGDYPGRHRFHGYTEIEGRNADRIADLVTPLIIRGSTQQLPPRAWVEDVKPLMQGDLNAAHDDELLDELIEKEDEIRDLERTIENWRLAYGEKTEEVAHQIGANERLRAQLRELGASVDLERTVDGVFGLSHPTACRDLLGLIHHLDHVSFPSERWEPTEELDVHPVSETYALEGWAAILAMESYGSAKAEGKFNGDFKAFCGEDGGTLPPNRVIMKESERTGNSSQYRSARTFKIDGHPDPVYMEPHIRICGNQPPAPRMHFFDDTRGPTKKMHIGYFGEHLPNKSTN